MNYSQGGTIIGVLQAGTHTTQGSRAVACVGKLSLNARFVFITRNDYLTRIRVNAHGSAHIRLNIELVGIAVRSVSDIIRICGSKHLIGLTVLIKHQALGVEGHVIHRQLITIHLTRNLHAVHTLGSGINRNGLAAGTAELGTVTSETCIVQVEGGAGHLTFDGSIVQRHIIFHGNTICRFDTHTVEHGICTHGHAVSSIHSGVVKRVIISNSHRLGLNAAQSCSRRGQAAYIAQHSLAASITRNLRPPGSNRIGLQFLGRHGVTINHINFSSRQRTSGGHTLGRHRDSATAGGSIRHHHVCANGDIGVLHVGNRQGRSAIGCDGDTGLIRNLANGGTIAINGHTSAHQHTVRRLSHGNILSGDTGGRNGVGTDSACASCFNRLSFDRARSQASLRGNLHTTGGGYGICNQLRFVSNFNVMPL